MNAFNTSILTTLMLLATTAMQAQVVAQDDPASGPESFVERQQAEQARRLKKKQKKQERVEKIDTSKSETYITPVYMFSISAEFGDSVVYFTGVQEVADVQLTRKYDYLFFRSDYSYQFTEYLGDHYGTHNQTTTVIFDKDKKKLMKRYTKIMKRYENDPDLQIRLVTESSFQFRAVEDLSNVEI